MRTRVKHLNLVDLCDGQSALHAAMRKASGECICPPSNHREFFIFSKFLDPIDQQESLALSTIADEVYDHKQLACGPDRSDMLTTLTQRFRSALALAPLNSKIVCKLVQAILVQYRMQVCRKSFKLTADAVDMTSAAQTAIADVNDVPAAQRNLNEAIRIMRTAYEQHPHDAEVILTLGLVGCEAFTSQRPLQADEVHTMLWTALKLDPEAMTRMSFVYGFLWISQFDA